MIPLKTKDIPTCSCLYDTYAPVLYGVILKLTPDVQKADNILEKSFVKIWRDLDGYDASKDRLFNLMLRVTLQECITEVGLSKNIIHHLLVKENHSTR